MTTIKLEDGTIVTGELVKKEKATIASKTFRYIGNVTSWKGKQRQIVTDVMRSDDKFWTLTEIISLATERGLTAIGGVPDSVKYHIHNLIKANQIEAK